MTCIFCNPAQTIWRNDLCYAIRDAHPVSNGHTLLIPHRHIPTWFDATRDEQHALIEAIDHIRKQLDAELHPDGYNIGINAGAAAGQTIFHLHVHVIPRYTGDVPDPRGGVRHVIPARGNYLASTPTTPHANALVTGATVPAHPDPLSHHLRPYLATARNIDILVAFLLDSGLKHLEPDLKAALQRGARVRVVTGDYLDVTDAQALRRLLSLDGRIGAWIFESRDESFHPKAWIFHFDDRDGVAFVGSSNMSWSALVDGVEWNLRVTASDQPAAFADVVAKFDTLLQHPRMQRITSDWIDRYEAQLERTLGTTRFTALVPGEVESDTFKATAPNSVQVEALQALRQARDRGVKRGLVVLATGLGKTFLSAFDSQAFKSVLFVAHREEILAQAMRTFQRIRPEVTCGMLLSGSSLSGREDVVFASVQTLSKMSHLERFAADAFDYIVVDEFHHAEAASYKRVLSHFTPRFLLGLTATPERTDGADLLKLCDGNLIYHCDVAEGVERELLCPFSYFGVPDDVDYVNIPWKSGRFDPASLEHAVATDRRAQNALEQWREKGGQRTLAFCCSVRHADFMASYFVAHGVAAVAVHSGNSSAPRALSLQQVERGDLQVVFTVDLFNEGLDVPQIDTVLMLRPTESRVLWLQQFGRGLRRSADKERLRVIDYIGNHRSFLLKPQALFDLPQGDAWVARMLQDARAGTLTLPRGCEVTYDLQVLDLLQGILKKDRTQELRFFYDDFVAENGRRPSAVETFLAGFNPRAAKKFHGSWLGFVDGLGGLPHETFAAARGFLDDLEKTPMEKSYKMAVVRGMLAAERFPGSITVDELTAQVGRLLAEDPRMRDDFPADAVGDERRLKALLVKNPLHFLSTGPSRDFFTLEGDVFAAKVAAADAPALRELVGEIVDWRLEEYLQRPGRGLQLPEGVWRCKVIQNSGGNPIVMLDRERNAGLPHGRAEVEVDGERYEGNFAKVALNTLYRPPSKENVLPEILRRRLGSNAGAPGTRGTVEFYVDEAGALAMRTPVAESAGHVQV